MSRKGMLCLGLLALLLVFCFLPFQRAEQAIPEVFTRSPSTLQTSARAQAPLSLSVPPTREIRPTLAAHAPVLKAECPMEAERICGMARICPGRGYRLSVLVLSRNHPRLAPPVVA